MGDNQLLNGVFNGPHQPVHSVRAEYFAAPELPEESQAHNWIEYCHIFRRNWKIVALAISIGGVCGLGLTLPKTPIYQARASIEVQEVTDNVLNLKDGASPSGSGVDSELMDMQTQIRIMQSDNLLERVAARVRQNFSSLPTQTLAPAWRSFLNFAPVSPESAREQAIGMAAGSINVRVSGQTRIIEITSDSTNPQIAASFANTLADEYIEQHVESRWQSAQRTSEKLTRALEDLRNKLEQSEDALQAYARASELLFTGDRISVSEDRLRQLQSSLSKAQEERMARQSRLDAQTTPEVLSDPSITATQDKLTDLRRQIAELDATYTPEYAKVKRLQAQLEPLGAALKKQISTSRARIRSDFDEAERHERLLAAAYDAQSLALSAEAGKKIHYDILKREVDSTRQLYDTMLSRVKEASIASAMKASNVRVLDAARAPLDPYQPRVRQMVLMSMLAGLFFGSIFIVAREHTDRTIQMPGDINLFLNVSELGVVPAATVESQRDPYSPRSLGLNEAGTALDGGLQERVELVTFQRHPSMLAESFRSTLTSLLFSGQDGTRPRVLVMTSANPSEGKTTVTTNLAIALASIRQRVLLIDGDMRRPRLHEIFELGETRGLRDALASSAPVEETLTNLIRKTAVDNLFVLSSGAGSLSATNLLYSPRMRELIDTARKLFDMVLIDTPPMLQIPDARVIGRAADSVILVVRAGRTTRDAALAVRQRLAEDGTPIAGCILNDWNPRHSPGGYYGYHDAPKSTYKNDAAALVKAAAG